MDASLIPLCQQGIRIMNYMDNWLLCAPTKQQARSNTEDVLLHLLSLGLMLNKEKSCLTPCRMVLYLGLVLDSMTMRACLNPQRILMLREQKSYLMGKSQISVKCGRTLLSPMAAASQVVPLGLLHMRWLHQWLIHTRRVR